MATAATAPAATGDRHYFELIKYHLHVGSRKNRVADFYRYVAIPALNRIGVTPVGVFNVLHGENKPTLYVLMQHKSAESAGGAMAQILNDGDVQSAGAGFIDAPLSDPAYVRMESSLMVGFSHMPKIEPPESLLSNDSRIYELRIYESHSKKANVKKVEMFNEGGEIAIFRKTGLQPVFFGEALIGPQIPNLTYMLVFDSWETRAERWAAFRGDPEWAKLRQVEKYKNTVSNITDIILRPMPFSQI
jgi:hypothetical protein